jgi:hypothetical protein
MIGIARRPMRAAAGVAPFLGHAARVRGSAAPARPPLFRSVPRAGLAGGRVPGKDSDRPALTRSSWVNIKAGWHDEVWRA